MNALYVRTGGEDVVMEIARPDNTVDFTLVNAAACTMQVRMPDGAEQTWTAVASSISASAITLTHTLAADGSDLPFTGSLSIYAKLPLTAGGYIRTDALLVPVLDAFDVTY